MYSNLKEIDVLILCGGLGKRLRPCVNNRPKVLAEIRGRAFLDILIDNLLQYDFENIILSVGYLKEEIVKHFKYRQNYKLMFSEEEMPLGTGGAVKKAKSLVKSSPFLVINGDSACKVDFRKFYEFHREKKATISMAVVRSKTRDDCGNIILDKTRRIINFAEKTAVEGKQRLVNAGIYLMERGIFSYMPNKKRFSLEYDFFPKMSKRSCYGFLTRSKLFDIGTPDRYKTAKNVLTDSYWRGTIKQK